MSQESSPNIKVKVFSSAKKQRIYDARDGERIADLIRKKVLPKTKVDYHSVSVKVEREPDGKPKALIAYLLRKDSYTADVAKVNIDQDYNVLEVLKDYDDSLETGDEAEEEAEEATTYHVFDIADFVVGTPVPEIPTAKAAVEELARVASAAGLTTKMLMGSAASVANYKHYLSSGPQAFVNIGHGNTNEIILDDGRLSYRWLDDLRHRPLSPCVAYFNSCQVHNPKLDPSIMSAGARTFIGGNVNLLIGPSEKVCMSFWSKVLLQTIHMGDSLSECEAANYPTREAHGISGDRGLFRTGHIIVFEHVNFRGHHRHVFGMDVNLNHSEDKSLNDRISSFVVVSGTWKLYQHVNFRSPLGGEYPPGEYKWVQAAGVLNDQVSSLRCIHS